MIKILLNNEWHPLKEYRNYFVDIDEEGNQSMQFDIILNDLYYKIKPEAVIQDDFNRWLVKGINQMKTYACITCDLDMDEWHSSYYLRSAEVEQLQTKSLQDALDYIKPDGWIIQNAQCRDFKRTLELEKCTAYDLLMRAKTVYDVQYDIDTSNKIITVVDPYKVIDDGVYITPELNLKSVNYKGDSKSIVTRLYCYGADDMTFADINNGKPYVENTAYKGKVVSASWTDGRYTNMESLLEEGIKKLAEMAVPTGAYTLDVIDLYAIDERYRNLELKLRSTVHCILDADRKVDVTHRVVKKRIFPENPSKNTVTLSNLPRTLEKEWNALKEDVQATKKDGFRLETEVRQTNREITSIAKRTDENTKGIQSVEQKITAEQLLTTISDGINNGDHLNTMKFILDINGVEIRNGGIKVYDNNSNLVLYIDEKTKQMVFNGKIQSVSGQIGGWEIVENGLKASWTRELPYYTESDKTKIRQYIMGEITLTDAEIDFLDVNLDGYISAPDYVAIGNILTGKSTRTWKYTYTINASTPKEFIKVTVDRGNGNIVEENVCLSSISLESIRGLASRINILENKVK